MQPAPIFPNESARLTALRRYDILDTPAEAEFDDFTRLAARICGAPMATITLVDTARQWFKSHLGLEATETPRDISFCGHAIAGSEILEVPNALEDERFRDNPLVTADPNVRFYAGAPLVTPDGQNIGALCVMDRTPHHLTPEQREMLTLLSRQVVHLLELRLAGRRIQWLNENLEHLVIQRTDELRESEERFRTLAEQSSEVFWFVGLNPERTLYVSPAVEKIWEQPAGRFYEDSRTWIKSLHGEDQARVSQAYEAALSGRSARFETEYRVLRPDGSLRWIMDSGTPIRNGAGEIIRIGGMAKDITERKQAEAALRAANAELEAKNLALRLQAEDRQAREAAEAANAAKDRFLAMLSHELRTPLSPVLYAVDLLENLPCPEPVRGPLETIRRNVQLEARLIDDLLDLARIRNGKLQLQVEPVDAHDLLRRAVEICQGNILQRDLQLTLDLRAQHFWLEADPARIQQIFWNLISNAVRYTPPGGAITVRSEDQEGAGPIRFEIIDTGIGLDPDQLERIFDAFEQGHGGRSGGLGLGLAICRALVTLHGGRIEAQSDGPGQGSRFTLTLPTVRQRNAIPVNVPAGPLQPTAQGLRLLLVEDHADTALTLGRLLANSGYAVQTAGSFATALRHLQESDFDLLVSDVGLPDGSGLDLMPKFIEAAAGRPIAGIALSGYGMPEDVEHSYVAGFHEHLTKPVDFALLRKALARVTTTAPAPALAN